MIASIFFINVLSASSEQYVSSRNRMITPEENSMARAIRSVRKFHLKTTGYSFMPDYCAFPLPLFWARCQ
jgi:hypothetical protein